MLQNILSIIFYVIFILDALLGVVGLMLNKKARLNQAFFGICLSISSLNYVFAIVNSLNVVDDVLIWGWVAIFAPMMILLPVSAFAYNINKLRILGPKEANQKQNFSDILSTDTHSTFVRYIALVYFSISVLILFKSFVFPTVLWEDMIFSTVLVIIGLIMFGLSLSDLAIIVQDRILMVMMAFSIPFTMFWFMNDRLGNIIWITPLTCLMMTIIFKRKKMFWVVSVATLATGMALWLIVPEQIVYVGTLDYLGRLILYAIAIILAAFSNKTYIARLKQNEQQVGFQKMIASITTNFVSVTRANFNDKVWDLLRSSGGLINADRAFIGIFSEDMKNIRYTHEWLGETIGTDWSKIGKNEKYRLLTMPWHIKKLLDNDIILLPSGDILTAEELAEKEIMNQLKIKAVSCIPIQGRDCIIGFIRYDQIRSGGAWRIDDLELLKVLANILADAFEKTETERKINQMAYYDPLTNLPNRVLFKDRLEQALALAKRRGKLIGVIFLDLDGFKEVNDTLGHNWGDQLLNQIGKRLSAGVRKYDTVARFGGDEFLIMVPQLSQLEDLVEIAEKIMTVFKQPVLIEEQEVYVNASSGIAVFPEDGENVNMLIKNADLAMYAAKKSGKGQIAFCSEDMKNRVLEKMSMTNSLYRAQERNELHLHYQPQVSTVAKEIIGFEALLRWNHPTLGAVSPTVFIPIAERTGLINSIGEWVLLTACAQNKAWQDAGFKPVPMGVNLSLEQFRNANLENIIKKCLAETGLEPKYLELEITEGIAMKESGDVTRCLRELKAIGVSISIDDFGTEFSSLSRLKDLPVDRLKIDMQFIQGISVNAKDESIITVMINLAKRLGLKVIAEGVETAVQLGFLRAENCDEIQGYYYFKPLSSDEIEKNNFELFTKK
ncbi:EAL domain-containing protein [Acetobacterium paludosum]|uniref:EAL domain-containing protein n=1 Tax=Acetobacterium paludosum TaxID=52693 RepID=A0A923HVH8_9FIRM|nr:EAL domain-containing protein [Acetobacterium paludosum]MBC3889036.1 EAL domain-containing protein [Acetobacterium paludosum]